MSVAVNQAAGPRVRGRRMTPRAAILVVLVTALLLYLVLPFRTYLEQRDRLQRLQHQTEVLEQQNQALHHQISQLNDPSYLERIARECLGMVKPGEIGFVITTKDGARHQPAE